MAGESKSSTGLRNLIEALPESDNKQRLLKLIPREERLTSISELNGKVHSRENILRMMEKDAPTEALKKRIQESLFKIKVLKKHPVPRLQRLIELVRSCLTWNPTIVNDDLNAFVFLGKEHAYWVFKELQKYLQLRSDDQLHKQDASNMLKQISLNVDNLEKALDGGDIESVKECLHVMKSDFVHFQRRYERFYEQEQSKLSKLYENIVHIFSRLSGLTMILIYEWKQMKQENLNTAIVQAYNIIAEQLPEKLVDMIRAYTITAEKIPEELVDMIHTGMRPVSLRL